MPPKQPLLTLDAFIKMADTDQSRFRQFIESILAFRESDFAPCIRYLLSSNHQATPSELTVQVQANVEETLREHMSTIGAEVDGISTAIEELREQQVIVAEAAAEAEVQRTQMRAEMQDLRDVLEERTTRKKPGPKEKEKDLFVMLSDIGHDTDRKKLRNDLLVSQIS